MNRLYNFTILTDFKAKRKNLEDRKKNANHIRVLKQKPLSLLVTKIKIKENAPRWNFTVLTLNQEDPEEIGGFIFDYDDYKKPLLNQNYTYYLHQTHSGRWRVILPFDKSYECPKKNDYKFKYFECMHIIFGDDTQHFLDNFILDKTGCTSGAFFILRPKGNPLIKNEGEYYQPRFNIINKETKSKVFQPHAFSPITDKNEAISIFNKIKLLIKYYRHILDFSPLSTLQTCCFMGWHSAHESTALKFNNASKNYPATIKCFFSSCQKKLLEFMKPYQDENNIVKDFTTLYCAAAIIKGIWTYKEIEYCALFMHLPMRENQYKLYLFSFIPRADVHFVLNLIYRHIFYKWDHETLYNYKNGVYSKLSKHNLIDDFQEYIGTYIEFKSAGKVKAAKYVEEIVKYVNGAAKQEHLHFIKSDCICFENGLLTLNDKNINFIPYDPRYFVIKKLNYNYDVEAKSPLWNKILCDYFQSLNAPQVRLLQEFCGYCLTSDRSLEKLLFVYGYPGAGKNTIIQTLLAVLGGDQTQLKIIVNYERRGKYLIDHNRFLFINEISLINSRLTQDELNKMASTDGVEYKLLYEEPYTTYNVPKLIIGFNEMPEKFKIDESLKRRSLAIKFIRSFSEKEKDKNLKKKLLTEKSGIFNWVLEGYKRLIKQNGFTEYTIDSDLLYEEANHHLFEIKAILEDCDKKEWKASNLYDYYVENVEGELIQDKEFWRILNRLKIPKKRRKKGIFYDLSSKTLSESMS